MGNLITNKDKQAKVSDHGEPPNSFQKDLTHRKLRREGRRQAQRSDEERRSTPGSIDRRALRKRSGYCPACLQKLEKNAKGRRYLQACKHCHAVFQRTERCPHCATHRVWMGPEGRWCKGCGKRSDDG
jgi:hypothetical protein